MSLKGKWKPRVDGVDVADSSAVNEIASAVIEIEDELPNLSGVYVGSGEMPAGYNVQVDPTGDASMRLSIGEVVTLPEGVEATATVTGTPDAPILNLGLPRGETGPQGLQGPQGEKGEPGKDLTEKQWVLVGDITLEQDVLEIQQDFPVNTYKECYIEAVLKVVAPTQTNAKSTRFNVMRQGVFITSVFVNVKDGDTLYLRANGWISPTKRQVYDVSASTYQYAYGEVNRNANDISSVEFNYLDLIIVSSGVNGVSFGAGSTVEIWGR